MKKKSKVIIAVLGSGIILLSLVVGCNKQLVDTVYSYDKVIMKLPNGEVVEGKVESWKDYDDGEQFQIKVNGKYYLVNSNDAVLIKE